MKRGFALPLTVVAMFSVILLLVFVHFLGSGYTDQVAHLDEVLHCRAIAESTFSRVVARIREKPYSERFFAGRPYRESDSSLFGGSYDLYVIDVPNKRDQADVYVRTKFGRASRLYFWRFLCEHSLLDGSGRVFPILFTSLDPERFPGQATVSPFSSYINGILEERKRKNASATMKAAEIRLAGSLGEVLSAFDGPVDASIIDSRDPATKNAPAAPPIAALPPTTPTSAGGTFSGAGATAWPPTSPDPTAVAATPPPQTSTSTGTSPDDAIFPPHPMEGFLFPEGSDTGDEPVSQPGSGTGSGGGFTGDEPVSQPGTTSGSGFSTGSSGPPNTEDQIPDSGMGTGGDTGGSAPDSSPDSSGSSTGSSYPG